MDHASCRKVAVITGASSGVGRAISLQLAQGGFDVALIGRDPSRLPVTECSARVRAQPYRCDLERDDLAALSDEIRRDFSRIDVLIQSAGMYQVGPDQSTEREFDQLLDINLRAPLLLTRSLLQDLIATKGDIIFINSSAGLNSSRRTLNYSISKYGLRALADGIRDEVNPLGVRVVSIFLGSTATPMQEEIHRAEGRPYVPEELIQPTDVAQLVAAVLTLPRTAEVTDVMVRPVVKPR